MSKLEKIFYLVFITVFVLFCVQCTSKVSSHIEHQKFLNKEETVLIENVVWEITYIDPPKHFWISIKNDRGEVIENTGRRKHCNKWRSIKVGSKHLFRTKYYTKPNSESPDKVYVKVLDSRKVCDF